MGRGVSSVLRPALLFFDDYSVSVGGYAEDVGEVKRSAAGIGGFGFERNVVEVYADDGIAAKIASCLLELFQRLRIAGVDVKHQVGVFAGTRGLRFALGEQPGHVIIQSDVSASLSCHLPQEHILTHSSSNRSLSYVVELVSAASLASD